MRLAKLISSSRVKLLIFREQGLVAFRPIRVGDYAIGRTDQLALRIVFRADALGALHWIDYMIGLPTEIALFGQTGSQASQAVQPSVIISAMTASSQFFQAALGRVPSAASFLKR
jgi:hypothetical protein